MSILVIGQSGQVARAIQHAAVARGIALKALGRPDIDLEQPDTIAAAIDRARPALVVNAAAYTAVDKAEDEPERAFRINAVGAEAAAKAAHGVGAPIIHVSTDYVFSGSHSAPHTESDAPAPQTAYGASKLEGERVVALANPEHLIVRTSWVFAARGQNFVRTMLRLAKTRPTIAVVDDQFGCPTYAADFAAALLDIATLLAKRRAFGIYHCAGAGEVSWAGLASATFAGAAQRGGPSATVTPIPTSEYPTRAKRPANSRLDCGKLADVYGVRLRPWPDAVSACLDEIAAQNWSVE